ncbi:MAG TPA: DSD1 family PLP-dependent enzyme [Rhizomicrobium sp.]|jgi:D-serine deaminase-like pyridoxal phosphate-dependent protein|nr:DSD1 family PLP-dependent enzyme [Rhizomicrobium sp.]
MNALELNRDLIGVAGGRWQLATPALVIDLDRFEENIARMARHARAKNIALRPHAKTHKCAEVARRQIAAGAAGICTAKLGEAEALADAGIDSILITSPVVTQRGIERLMALNARVGELIAVCDSPVIAERLATAASLSGKRLALLVDIDPGMGRTGLPPDETAAALVRAVSKSPALVFRGLQCYAGNLQHLESANERRAKSLSALAALDRFCHGLRGEGIIPEIVSGAGTGTFDIDPDAHVLTELQVGSYIFMDRQYNDVWEGSGVRPPFETSLFLQTTVISANRAGVATTDAGLKAFATDAGPPIIAGGAPQGATYFFFGDEQGGIEYSPSEHRLMPGDVITCAVPHCDPTVNLHDYYHVIRGDRLEAIWPIEARGCSA